MSHAVGAGDESYSVGAEEGDGVVMGSNESKLHRPERHPDQVL